MILFAITFQEHAGKSMGFAYEAIDVGYKMESVKPRNEAEAAAALHDIHIHGLFGVFVSSKNFQLVNLLQRAIQGKWRDMTVIVQGIRFDEAKIKKEKVPPGATTFKTVTLEKVGVMRSEVSEDHYYFRFRVFGSGTEEDASE